MNKSKYNLISFQKQDYTVLANVMLALYYNINSNNIDNLIFIHYKLQNT